MVGAILKATNSSFQKGMTFCRSIYVKKVMKLLAFIFEQPSYFMRIFYWQTILMKYHDCLIFFEITKGVTKFVVCCIRDWRFED